VLVLQNVGNMNRLLVGVSVVDQQQLREYLDELNAAIEELQASDSDKGKLAKLIAEIELQLDDTVLESGDPQTLADQVDEMVSSFEQEHPAVAGILNNIMLTLSSMGV
jgi:hypothetical protein